MTATEQRYGQIEKEALALTWACKWLADYLVGLQFHIETDHKTLVPLLGTKHLPIRIQHFRMRLMHFLFTISYVPGKHLITADALSRAPITNFPESEEELHKSVDMYVCAILSTLPATDKRIKRLQRNQTEDEVCQLLITFCTEGWPNKNRVPGILKPYYQVASELPVVDGLLLQGFWIVITSSLHLEVLDQIHAGHQGIHKCRQRASQSVWQPDCQNS